MNNEIINVMVVDDHPMVRKGLAMFVGGSEGMQLAGEASNAVEALETYRRVRPDVVLMDMVMPGQSGADAMELIRREFPDSVVIALTSFGEEELISAALKAGARGFLYKTVSVEELAEAIRQAYRGRSILDPKAADVMLKLVKGSSAPPPVAEKPELSEREKEVLALMVEGLTNRQIAARLKIQPTTVKQYSGNIFSKLKVSNRTEAVAIAVRLGIVDK